MIYRCCSNFIASRNARLFTNNELILLIEESVIINFELIIKFKLVNKKRKENDFKFSDINIFQERKR